MCSPRCPKDGWFQPPPTNHFIPALCNTKLFSSSSAMDSNLSSPIESSSSSKLVLYSYWQSSCSWRVRFALSLKGLSYEYRAVNLSKGEQFDPEFEKLNPLRYVPVLVDGGDVVIADSYAILLYLEEKYPKHPLLPLDPQLRAINLQAASIVCSSIQPLHMLSLLVCFLSHIFLLVGEKPSRNQVIASYEQLLCPNCAEACRRKIWSKRGTNVG
nr:glutathione S-transferase zeta class-like isoform X1 [Ipomoea batatas]